MRQRIMIAMALASKPDILIADEATTALDVTTQAQLLEMIRDIAKRRTPRSSWSRTIWGWSPATPSASTSCTRPHHGVGGLRFDVPRRAAPYTRCLLRAIPRLDDPKDRVLIPIDGLPPVPAQRPDHCPFYDRCPYREERCLKPDDKVLREARPNHFTASA